MKKTLLFLAISILSITATLSTSAKSFSDLTTSHFYHSAVNFISDQELVIGYTDGTFKPDNQINRAEMTKIIVAAVLGDPEATILDEHKNKKCFDDVDANEWFTKYICYAKSRGWINGYSDGTFKPGNDISFVEAQKILLASNNIPLVSSEPWYKDIVEKATDYNGIPLTITAFDQKISRGEMADMIARRIKFQNNNLDEYLGEERACTKVNYDTISQGTNMRNQMNSQCEDTDTENEEKLTITTFDATTSSITLTVEGPELQEAEKYFAECTEVGQSGMFFPEKLTTTNPIEITAGQGNIVVKAGTAYSCYVGIKTPTGQLKNISEHMQITTLSIPDRVMIENDIIMDVSIGLYVKAMELGEDESYHAKCIEDGQNENAALGYSYPQTTGKNTYLTISRLSAGKSYNCYAAIIDNDGVVSKKSALKNYTIPANDNQLKLVEAYSGYSNNLGYYVYYKFEELDLRTNDFYFLNCENSAINQITSKSNEIYLTDLEADEIYTCSGAVNFKLFPSETITKKTPANPV